MTDLIEGGAGVHCFSKNAVAVIYLLLKMNLSFEIFPIFPIFFFYTVRLSGILLYKTPGTFSHDAYFAKVLQMNTLCAAENIY
jgi:hypothetical protein